LILDAVKCATARKFGVNLVSIQSHVFHLNGSMYVNGNSVHDFSLVFILSYLCNINISCSFF